MFYTVQEFKYIDLKHVFHRFYTKKAAQYYIDKFHLSVKRQNGDHCYIINVPFWRKNWRYIIYGPCYSLKGK